MIIILVECEGEICQVVGIQMFTNCCPLLADHDIFLYSHEAGYIQTKH